ncbi:hypothetical protein [Paenibacillus phocaensis]|jgi:hypothetical protein|uniref:hypothetical protein n=1 Tax=Paenibacillus phocaensis TaxID=1776378 RepID=UPI000839D376|nr:hypothetical protein [Paenibacillus phocaensis]
MNFKDYIALDIDGVFFNPDEFADEVLINGERKIVTIDDEQLKKRAEKEYFGVTTGMLLYFIPVASLPEKPEVGQTQFFNKKLYYIDDVKEAGGVYEIVLNQNRGE